MSHTKLNQDKLKRPEVLEQSKQDVKLKMFVQMLAIKRDTNMTRIYSAIQSTKKNEE
jgi:hypothetical protein